MRRIANGIIGAVGRFLFAPTDPSPLGFMRIMTGILVLYSTFAYSFDLKWLMGPDAFSNQDMENQARRERSYVSFPVSWEVFEPTVKLEDAPHRREAAIEFMRGLPESIEDRKQKLQFLARVVGLPYEEQQSSFFLPNSVARLATEAEFNRVTKALESSDPKMADSPVTFPPFVWKMSVPERLAFWREIRTFTDLLPVDPLKQEIVLSWLSYYPFDSRKDLVRFLAGDLRKTPGKQPEWSPDPNGASSKTSGRQSEFSEAPENEPLKPGEKQFGLPANPEVRQEFLRYLDQWGMDPRQFEMKSTPIFSAYFHLKNPLSMWTFHMMVMCIAIMFTVGLYTRTMGVLLYLTSLSYIHRSGNHMFGQDTMQTILLAYLMIGPSGATFSLDALRKRYRASRALMAAGGKPVPWAENVMNGPQPSWQANFVLRLFQMHYGVIYLASGASKLKGNAWWNHNAGWMTLANPDFGLVPYPIYENALHWLADHRMLALLFTGFSIVFTIGLEVSFIFLVWTRARPVMVVWSLLFHTSIAVFMGLCVFAMNMFVLLLCYFPAKLIRERIGVLPGTGDRLTVRYNDQAASQTRRIAILRALDLAGQITFVQDPTAKSVTLTDPRGNKSAGNAVLGDSLTYLALTKPVSWILRLMSPKNESYDTPSTSLPFASGLFFGGIAVALCGIFGLTLAYVDNNGNRPEMPLMLVCVSAIIAGSAMKLGGLRSLIFKGAL
ncbi:HTTM domain-containing protein [Zavarzinella formosa]|uniref:HTTM domain-containing protein n=1 Tax=Zavarzinella formosa TaxID=360055 RepID=UPI00036C0C65|nr:HTTM domain-containing protein [Zavarzinella formosa]